MVITVNLLLALLSILAILAIAIVIFYKIQFRHWKKLNVECKEPKIPYGNSYDFIVGGKTNGQWSREYYDYLKGRNVKYGGFYSFFVPTFFPIDLDLIKRIMQTDFAHFMDHVSYANERDDPLSYHLFSYEGKAWRNMRTKLTPVFTSGKMKNMFSIMLYISEELVRVLQRTCDTGVPFEAKDISARFTTDVIGACAFGIDCNTLENPNADFRVYGKRLFQPTSSEAKWNLLAFVLPKFCKILRVRVFPKPATDFFWKIIQETVKYREETGLERNDAMQLLLDIKNNENLMTYNELAAQAFIFFSAGFETSSSLISFALIEMAINQKIQEKLRKEIYAVLARHNNQVTYKAVQEMRYLEMVANETLRKYPTLASLSRTCTKDYKIPDSDIVLKKGSHVFIPVEAIHYDPEYYPDPETFDPDRFTSENRSARHQFTFLPWGEGPRACIGIRFGLMQFKLGMVAIIKNFKVTVNPLTELPIKINPGNGLTSSLGDLFLDLKRV